VQEDEEVIFSYYKRDEEVIFSYYKRDHEQSVSPFQSVLF